MGFTIGGEDPAKGSYAPASSGGVMTRGTTGASGGPAPAVSKYQADDSYLPQADGATISKGLMFVGGALVVALIAAKATKLI
jgi:hypothetical protein